MNNEEKKELVLSLLQDKKGLDCVWLDLRKVTTLADFFVICTGEVDVHVKALADAVLDGMKKAGVGCWHYEGYDDRRWVVLDYADVVVHIFNRESREMFDLENLWGDAAVNRVEAEV